MGELRVVAPAFLALAELVKIAKQKLNVDHASIKILVNADAKQKCFQLDLSLVQSRIDRKSVV